MGCGRVGSSLAIELESAGHSVSVIDQARESFRRLGPNFKGHTVTGMGFDRDTLLEAGIEKADAFAAVSNGDNSNILAARVARETYKVANVVAGAVQLCEFHPVASWYGISVARIENITGARVAFITRLGAGLIPDEHTVFQEGDLLHMMVRDEDHANVEKSFSHAPEDAS